jgi:hypothetical protein
MRYTHNYIDLHNANAHNNKCVAEFYTAMFEREAAEHVQQLRAKDVGAVVCYYDSSNNEAAYFDYENLVGSIYAVTGRRSDEI